MEDTAKVIGAKIGREKLEKQTQTRVNVYVGTPWGERGLLAVDIGKFTDVIIGF